MPTVVEAIGLSHPANAILLETLESHDVSRIGDFAAARRLMLGYRVPGRGPFEVVEVVGPGQITTGRT